MSLRIGQQGNKLQQLVSYVMLVPQKNIKIPIQIEGRNILMTILLGTSSSVYGTKKSVTAVLYCKPCIFKSSVSPAILAFPTMGYC